MNNHLGYVPRFRQYNLTEAEQKELIQEAIHIFKLYHQEDI